MTVDDVPAFPSGQDQDHPQLPIHVGLSRREYVATQLLAAMIASRSPSEWSYLADHAVQKASQLLHKLEDEKHERARQRQDDRDEVLHRIQQGVESPNAPPTYEEGQTVDRDEELLQARREGYDAAIQQIEQAATVAMHEHQNALRRGDLPADMQAIERAQLARHALELMRLLDQLRRNAPGITQEPTEET